MQKQFEEKNISSLTHLRTSDEGSNVAGIRNNKLVKCFMKTTGDKLTYALIFSLYSGSIEVKTNIVVVPCEYPT